MLSAGRNTHDENTRCALLITSARKITSNILMGDERIIPGSRRPDGTLRREIRVRPGYVPLEEQEIYVSRGAKVIYELLHAAAPSPRQMIAFSTFHDRVITV